MYDIHTHLYFESYDKDREVVIARAKALGIEKMIVVGCTTGESLRAVELAEEHPELFASVGIHPHTFNEFGISHLESWTKELRELAKNKKVVAIGECGLDYYLPGNQKAISSEQKTVSQEQKTCQKEGFQQQIALAEELALPLIVHTRPSLGSMDAYEDMFEILKPRLSTREAVILHCYMGDTEITKKFLEIPNLFFSFAGNITYPVKKALIGSKDDLGETVKLVPLDRILAETDCPFLSPQSHRGERNEPAYVVSVVEKIALLKETTAQTTETVIQKTVQKVFTL